MRNRILDVLNGARFFIKDCKSVEAASNILEILMGAVEKHPNENWVDALSHGQTASKDWLISSAIDVLGAKAFDNTLCVGGWIGTLPFALKAKGGSYTTWTSVDISEKANKTAETLNPFLGFSAVTSDMYNFDYLGYGLVINTSCEHINDLGAWLELIPRGTKLILQSNNMFEMEDHVNCHDNQMEFLEKTEEWITPIFLDELELPWHGWKRFMIIGEKR